MEWICRKLLRLSSLKRACWLLVPFGLLMPATMVSAQSGLTLGADGSDDRWHGAIYRGDGLDEIAHPTFAWDNSERRPLQSLRQFAGSIPRGLQREAAFELLARHYPSQTADSDAGQMLAQDSMVFCGKPVSCFGTIVKYSSISEFFPEGEGALDLDRQVAWVRSEFDDPVWLLVDQPTGTDPRKPIPQPGDRCEVLGYFVKMLRVTAEIGSESAAWVISEGVIPLESRIPQEIIQTLMPRQPLSIGENAAYYRVLKQVMEISAEQLDADATAWRNQRIALSADRNPKVFARFEHQPDQFPIYVDLFRNPDAYAGKPVTLRGRVRGVVQFPAEPNAYGIEQLYEVRMFPEDGQRYPAMIVCSELPEGFPRDAEVVEGVHVTGLLFKIYAYPGVKIDEPNRRVTRFAPLILAHRIAWDPSEPELVQGPLWWLVVAGFLIAAGLVPGILVIKNWRADCRNRSEVSARALDPDQSLSHLTDALATDPDSDSSRTES